MMKPTFWNQVKDAAQADPTVRIQALDKLLTEYHQCPKNNVTGRHTIAKAIVAQSGTALEKSAVDGEYVAARIIQMSAQDTLKRLSFDMEAMNVKQTTGMTPKTLIKAFRPERLDPNHHKWGLAVNEYKEYRSKWEQELLGYASNPNSGELAVTSLYDYLAAHTPKYDAPTKYYTPVAKARKRLLIANPGEANKSQQTEILRQSKKSDGSVFKSFDTKGSRHMFVLDGEKHFYAAKPSLKDGKWKHHSSLADGACILGAGEMEVKNGKIVSISQRSGHYHPDPEQVLNVLDVLKESGVDLSQVRLYAYTYFNDPSGKQPDKDISNQPRECFVPADYYLATNGKWAHDPMAYKNSPGAHSAPMIGEIITDVDRVWRLHADDLKVPKKETSNIGYHPESMEPLLNAPTSEELGYEAVTMSVPIATPVSKPVDKLGANAPRLGLVHDRVKFFEKVAKANAVSNNNNVKKSPPPLPDSGYVEAKMGEGDWA